MADMFGVMENMQAAAADVETHVLIESGTTPGPLTGASRALMRRKAGRADGGAWTGLFFLFFHSFHFFF